MSRNTFLATMTAILVLSMSTAIFGACSVRKAEEPTKESDTTVSTTIPTEETTEVPPTTEETTTVPPTTEETTRSIEELANLVLDQGINGDERKAYLGERYEEVQAWIDANYQPPVREDYSYPSGSGVLTPESGVNYNAQGILETYYCLPMDGVVDWMHSLGYEGEYWVRDDGVKMFGQYVMVAAEYEQFPKGSIVETSLGTGIVCDTGLGGYDWFDIATSWDE